MGRESYVSPVTGATEPPSERAAVWRFRLVAFVLLLVIGGLTAWGINQLMHLGDQDPTSIPNEAPGVSGP
ncbi:MAG TPA: hypothetical protein VGX28_09830 [Frankiaceae bacterium]|nr:hypothetical protein [Frankiaceae bacterium]